MFCPMCLIWLLLCFDASFEIAEARSKQKDTKARSAPTAQLTDSPGLDTSIFREANTFSRQFLVGSEQSCGYVGYLFDLSEHGALKFESNLLWQYWFKCDAMAQIYVKRRPRAA